MQETQDELNRVQDFDLDGWIDGIEPTHRTQTVNTRGDLLKDYSIAQEELKAAVEQLQRLADRLPDVDPDATDPMETLAGAGDDADRTLFEQLQATIAELAARSDAIATEYGQHRARVSFKQPDKSTQARLRSAGAKKSKDQNIDDTGLRLMHAAIIEFVVVQPGTETVVDVSKWTLARWGKFLDKIGNGQSKLLMDAYLGLAQGEVDAPFSQES